jgi:hypothetical protein
MLWIRRVCVAMLIASLSLFLYSGCEVAASYLLYDLIAGGPIFGDDDNDSGNHPPQIVTIQALPNPVVRGGIVTLTAVATDADGDDLTYLWQAAKGEFSDPTTEVTMWTSPMDPTGTYQIALTVNDGNGGIDTGAIDVQVTL